MTGDENAFVRDTGVFPQFRGDRLEALVKEGKADLDFILPFLEDPSSYMKSVAARCLGIIKARGSYSGLLKLMADPEVLVRADAILAMGESQDSRFTFPLINYFNGASYEEQRRIFLAFSALRDPRAVCFLKDFIKRDDDLGELARQAYSACWTNLDFNYTFAGREDLFEEAKEKQGEILLSSVYDLEEELSVLQDPNSRLLSYIVNERGMFLGELRDEHVFIAKGEKVLSAGEISFLQQSGNDWIADYTNNRSNGYYPDGSSFVHVRNALQRAGVSCDDAFSEVFPRGGFCDPEFLQDKPFYQPRIT